MFYSFQWRLFYYILIKPTLTCFSANDKLNRTLRYNIGTDDRIKRTLNIFLIFTH